MYKKFFCSLVLLLNVLISTYAAEPQFQLGDTLSIYSDRAYRREGGDIFEAVGNVVVLGKEDTMYGESASFDRTSMKFRVEGNVRLISQDMTLYGSHMEYNASTGYAEVTNARIITSAFNVVARTIRRLSEKRYEAIEAEFTTCRDCTESWAVYGQRIIIQLGQYAEIHHGLAKIKGVNVLYLPYIVLPIQTRRKTGLLFPRISTRVGEGLALEQPFFWAIDESRDMTVSPTFWARRGYGSDIEYRQRFGKERWLYTNSRLLSDTIYLPYKSNQASSDTEYFRYFGELENHWLWNPNLVHHFRVTDTRDLDIVRDHPQFTDQKITGSDLGFRGFMDWRSDIFSLGIEGDYLRNQLVADPEKFDRRYVQTVPRLNLSMMPQNLLQSSVPGLNRISFGFDSSITRFRQVDPAVNVGLYRNTDRLTANPYLLWNFFSWGPVGMSTEVKGDYQRYSFREDKDSKYEKNATMFKTEISFTMDKIFGLSYEEKVSIRDLPARQIKELDRETKRAPKPLIQNKPQSSKLVGSLAPFDSSITEDWVTVKRNAYRHSQDFKFIHHYISSENRAGNSKFDRQINSGEGWFDYADAIRSQEALLGANSTRTIIPPQNTMEFQWQNTLIRKSPKVFNFLDDNRYLRDNFTYRRIGYFNLSQGYRLDDVEADDGGSVELRDRLTRLAIQTGYSADHWNLNISEYFFHQNSQHIFQTGYNRQFELVNLLGAYNYNSFEEAGLHTLSAGAQVRPTDVLGFAVMREMDLEAKELIRTQYSLDIMPNNNCWILNLNYNESLVGFRYSFNILFNFGDDNFKSYRQDYFRIRRW